MQTEFGKVNTALNVVNVLIPVCLWGLFVWVWSFGPEVSMMWFREHGIIEISTVIAYIIFLVIYLVLIRLQYTLCVPILVTLMMFRELDFHVRFTSIPLTKLRFFTSNEVSLYEMLVGGLVWFLMIFCVVRVGMNFFKPTLVALKRGRVYAWAGVACIISIVLSKTLDGLGRSLASIGIEISKADEKYLGGIEEVIEMGIPLYMILAVVAYVVLSKQAMSAKV